MPKYYEFKICGYYLYYTSSCVIEALHVHASDRKMTEAGSAKFFVKSNGDTTIEKSGNLTEREIRKIREFIKNNYKEMYLKWIEIADTGFPPQERRVVWMGINVRMQDAPKQSGVIAAQVKFDVPSLATMYVYKPMKGHNLMQAIARVNRVFQDKEGGLVVDYVGIASALKEAMNDYTSRDKKNYGDTDIAKAAYSKFFEKLSVCRDLFHGYDYSKFFHGSNLERSKAISEAVNFIVAVDKKEKREDFMKEALMLRQALSLCSSIAEENLRIEAAFFESVRVLVVRLANKGEGKKISLPEMNARVNELLKASIKSDGVINLFSDVSEKFSLFDAKFLAEIAKMEEKNLAVELLKKLIAEQVQVYRHTNVVKSEKFSEIIHNAMNRYLNGMLTNEQVIEELLNLAKQIAAAQEEGRKLGLTADELAFYDALTKPQAIKDFYEHKELIAITKELTDALRKNRTIDWQKRDSARAKMRMLIKKLLKKHKYPPKGMDDAVQTVMTQCELWTDNHDMEADFGEIAAYDTQISVAMAAEEPKIYGSGE